MHYYDIKNGRDLVSVDEILSLYLWGQKTPPKPTALFLFYSYAIK